MLTDMLAVKLSISDLETEKKNGLSLSGLVSRLVTGVPRKTVQVPYSFISGLFQRLKTYEPSSSVIIASRSVDRQKRLKLNYIKCLISTSVYLYCRIQ
jgi:hypothetical protein